MFYHPPLEFRGLTSCTDVFLTCLGFAGWTLDESLLYGDRAPRLEVIVGLRGHGRGVLWVVGGVLGGSETTRRLPSRRVKPRVDSDQTSERLTF